MIFIYFYFFFLNQKVRSADLDFHLSDSSVVFSLLKCQNDYLLQIWVRQRVRKLVGGRGGHANLGEGGRLWQSQVRVAEEIKRVAQPPLGSSGVCVACDVCVCDVRVCLSVCPFSSTSVCLHYLLTRGLLHPNSSINTPTSSSDSNR